MVELGSVGFQETDSFLLSYFDKSRWSDDSFDRFKNDLRLLLQKVSVNADVRFQEIREENWNEQWEKTIQPIEIGERFTIKPSWSEYNNRDHRIVIQIDPKMSFGTGYHETTRLILRLLEKYVVEGSTVLDVGTGTGILAIGSVKLGAASAVGIDIDDWSIQNAQENILSNKVAGRVVISDRPLDTFDSSSVDLIAANLTLNTNIQLLNQFLRVLKTKGVLILSGLLLGDHDAITEHLVEKRFHILDELIENEWIAITAQKTQ